MSLQKVYKYCNKHIITREITHWVMAECTQHVDLWYTWTNKLVWTLLQH